MMHNIYDIVIIGKFKFSSSWLDILPEKIHPDRADAALFH